MKIHKSVKLARVMAACERREVSLDNPGFCLACGAEVDGCEPDARDYECDECGETKVYGAMEVLMWFV